MHVYVHRNEYREIDGLTSLVLRGDHTEHFPSLETISSVFLFISETDNLP